MNYTEMSDFKLNEAVANLVLWSNKDCEDIYVNVQANIVSWGDGANWHEFNPCNNPSDAYSIIFDNKIGLQHFNNGTWQAHCRYNAVCHNKNPLRAAMIVFLMMNEEQK